MKNTIVLIACSLLFIGTGWGQENKLDRANKKFNQYAFVDARKIYLEVAEEGYESADLFEKIGDSYYFNAKYDFAEKWYAKLINKYANETSSEYYFRYAQTLRALKNYALSDQIMTRFNEMVQEDTRADLFKVSPDYLSSIGYRNSKYTIENIRNVNSRYSDFAPTAFEGKLIFASTRDTGAAAKRIHKWNNEPFLDLYVSKVDATKKTYGTPKKYSGTLNTKFHESTTTFSKDGNTIYFTRNNYTDGDLQHDSNGTNKLKIYKSTRESRDEDWNEAVELSINGNEYNTAHPTLNAAGTKLFFASDRPGSVGQSDIWVAEIAADGSLGTPQNMGSSINTEGRETFPFMSNNGNLYFASDGHPGLGGLDMYVITPGETNAALTNLGEPINSSYDDFSFIVNDSTKIGYFASNRKRGQGSDDIYGFVQIADPLECMLEAKGIVSDILSKEPIAEALVQLLDRDNQLIATVTSNEKGEYTLNQLACEGIYLMRATKQGYNTVEARIETPDQSGTLTKNFELEPIGAIEEGADLGILLDLQPIYFDFDRFNIRPDAQIELAKIIAAMRTYPDLVIEVRAHTDSRGNDAYNLSLSDKRAKATVAYIIDKGIDRNRISGEGYGEKEPVNECTNGAKCTEEAFQLNRRSEFIIIKK